MMISFFILPIDKTLPDDGIIILEICESFNVTDDDDDDAPSTRDIDDADDWGYLMLIFDITILSVEYMMGTTACERWNDTSLSTADDPCVNERSDDDERS